MSKRLRLATVLAAAALILAACGNDSDGDSTSQHNDADVTFAQDMIPHHAQAIVMSKVAKKQAKDPELRQLAADIQAAQGPEIEQMSEWLKTWGEDVPQGAGGMDGDHDMGDMGDGDMPGMMTGRQMMRLDKSSGSRFDRMWLQMMIQHHEGAIEMAKVEQRNGLSGDAIELAKAIESAQTDEIALMKSMLRP